MKDKRQSEKKENIKGNEYEIRETKNLSKMTENVFESRMRKRDRTKSKDRKRELMDKYQFERRKKIPKVKALPERKKRGLPNYKSKYKKNNGGLYQESKLPTKPECRVF